MQLELVGGSLFWGTWAILDAAHMQLFASLFTSRGLLSSISIRSPPQCCGSRRFPAAHLSVQFPCLIRGLLPARQA